MVNIAKLKLLSRGRTSATLYVTLDKIRAETAPALWHRNSRKAKLRHLAVGKTSDVLRAGFSADNAALCVPIWELHLPCWLAYCSRSMWLADFGFNRQKIAGLELSLQSQVGWWCRWRQQPHLFYDCCCRSGNFRLHASTSRMRVGRSGWSLKKLVVYHKS